jgi:hypothetical protein
MPPQPENSEATLRVLAGIDFIEPIVVWGCVGTPAFSSTQPTPVLRLDLDLIDLSSGHTVYWK